MKQSTQCHICYNLPGESCSTNVHEARAFEAGGAVALGLTLMAIEIQNFARSLCDLCRGKGYYQSRNRAGRLEHASECWKCDLTRPTKSRSHKTTRL